MKIYVMTIIAIGLMFLFYLAGIGTPSMVLSAIGGKATNSTTASGDVTDTQQFSNSNLFLFAGIFIAGVIAMSVTSIQIGGYSLNTPLEALIGAFIGGVYLLFATDLFAIVSYVGSLTGSTGWIYYSTWAIIVPLLGGYTISLIEFIRGND